MSSCPSLVIEPLISQALLGTSFKSLDLSFLPDALQPSAKAIQSTSPDQESCLFKIAALLISQDQTSISLERNSFSLEQMSLYQQAVETDLTALKTSKKSSKTLKTSTQEQSAPSEECVLGSHSTQESLGSQEIQYSQVTPLDQATVKAILSEVKKHKGPMPLPQVTPDERPVFPKSVENVLNGFIFDDDEYQILLFQTLQQLSACNMRFSERVFPKLAALFRCTFRVLDYHFSSVMCQELLIKCGGPNFLYVLPFYLPTEKSIFFKLPYRTGPVYTMGNYSNGTLYGCVEGGDWETLFQKANNQDALGLFIKLRHDYPALARNLLSANAMRFRPSPRTELIKAMKVNLSLDDEPLLFKMVHLDCFECSSAAKELLSELHGSQYAQNCAQVVKEHLIYEPKQGQWLVKPIDQNDAMLTSLGISLSKKPINTATNECLIQLLSGMDWEDLRDLTKATELKEVFIAWNNLKLFKSYELNIPELLAGKIYASKDKKAARAFVQDYPRKFYLDDKAGRVLMLLDTQERIDALKLWRSCDPCPDWFVELDYVGPLYKIHYVDESWLEAVLQICLDHTEEDEAMDRQGRSRIFEVMSPSCMAWLLPKLEQFRTELDAVQDKQAEVREKINLCSPRDKCYNNLINTSQNLSFKRRMWQYRVYVVESLKRMLQQSILIKVETAKLLEDSFASYD